MTKELMEPPEKVATLTKAYAAQGAIDALRPFSIQRREVGPQDVRIEILYCGICHSDVHQARNEWGTSIYPMVPGHEIVGRVTEVGELVTRFTINDLAGVGCFVDSCRQCRECVAGDEQYCQNQLIYTYNGYEKDGKTPTYGGYSTQIVVDQNYALKISSDVDLPGVAPLLCAGITTYSPLRHWKVGRGHKVGVAGLGGLGHMAVKLAVSLGAEVTLLSTSPSKEADAWRLGAHCFALTTRPESVKMMNKQFDFIIDTIPAPHDYGMYLGMLKTNGTMICVGVPTQPMQVPPFSLIGERRSVAGSMIGGIAETQEMLDYCAEHGIRSDVEIIPIEQVNEAYERLTKGEVKYRFVIDMASLK